MCGYLCIRFNNFILKDQSLLEYTSLFTPNEFEENDKITFTYFQQDLNKLKYIVMLAINIQNQKKNTKTPYFSVSMIMNMKKQI